MAAQLKKPELDQPFDVAFDKAGTSTSPTPSTTAFGKSMRRPESFPTVAGNGKKGFSGDGGKATEASLNEPYGLEFDANGNLFIVDRLQLIACARWMPKLRSSRQSRAPCGKSGYGGDDGPADKAAVRRSQTASV